MGRPKLKKSKTEIREQAERWRVAHNLRRREKYKEDDTYRDRIHTTNRDRYRTENEVEFRGCVSTAGLCALAVSMPIQTASGTRNLLCLGNEQMAEALGGYHKFVFHRWQRSGRFPRATHSSVLEGVRRGVFLLPEAKALLAVMRDHQKDNVYLTRRDTMTISKLYAAVGETPPVV